MPRRRNQQRAQDNERILNMDNYLVSYSTRLYAFENTTYVCDKFTKGKYTISDHIEKREVAYCDAYDDSMDIRQYTDYYSLNHQNILHLLDVKQKNSDYTKVLIFELPETTLDEHLSSHVYENARLQTIEWQLRELMRMCLESLHVAHSKNLYATTYGLSLENCYVNKENNKYIFKLGCLSHNGSKNEDYTGAADLFGLMVSSQINYDHEFVGIRNDIITALYDHQPTVHYMVKNCVSFWSATEKAELARTTNSMLNSDNQRLRDRKRQCLHAQLDQTYTWRGRVDQRLLSYADSMNNGVQYQDNPVGLVKFVRHMMTHFELLKRLIDTVTIMDLATLFLIWEHWNFTSGKPFAPTFSG